MIMHQKVGTIIALPKEQGKLPTVYYHASVLKHPISGRSPIPVAELITSDHTVLSISFFWRLFVALKVCYLVQETG